MRTVVGILLGLLLFFPGIALVKWLSNNVVALYPKMTNGDACLVIIMILMCVYLVRTPVARSSARPRRGSTHTSASHPSEPHLEYLSGPSTRTRSRTSSRRRRE